MSLKLSKFSIVKAAATGNDFLLVNLLTVEQKQSWATDFGPYPRTELVRQWCDRHNGIGADGMVFLEADPELDFAWDFYNSDGSTAEMCGNATRAVSLYMQQLLGKNSLRFRTRVGVIIAEVQASGLIDAQLPAVGEHLEKQDFKFKGVPVFYDFVRAGVPHCVIRVPNFNSKVEMREQALVVKSLEPFEAEGTNVTFIRDVAPFEIDSITFERGVEDFTLSCGTGAVAAAYAVLKGKQDQAVKVNVPGGQLTVIWKENKPHLIGPARIVAAVQPLELKP